MVKKKSDEQSKREKAIRNRNFLVALVCVGIVAANVVLLLYNPPAFFQ